MMIPRRTLLLLPLALAALAGCQDRDLPTLAAPPGGAVLSQAPASSLLFWDFENATSIDRVSTSIGAPGVTGITGVASQTCGGPAENLDPDGGLMHLTRDFGICHPFIEFVLTQSLFLTDVRFDHQHNHNFGFSTYPSYSAQLQIDVGAGYVDIGNSLLLEGSNVYQSGASIALNTLLGPGTYRIRWDPRDLNVGFGYPEHTDSEYFALNDVSLNGNILYAFSGFFSPVDNLPTVNVAKAGSAIPVKFSLGGDQGLGIFASGYPRSQAITCDAAAPQGPVEETVTAGSSSLSYDAATQRYTYVWKSDKAWANSCRMLTLQFTDGSTHTASFKFTK